MATKLPFSLSVLKNCQYINPQKRNEAGALTAISNLAMELSTPLQGVLNKVFPKCLAKEEICDNVRNEWREFQIDTLSNNYFLLKKIPANGCKQGSYWEKAFELGGIPNDKNGDEGSDGCFELDALIISLKDKIVTESGLAKYPMLLLLFKTVASLSHRNSAPANGFSINQCNIGLHGNSIQADTIKVLRMVKDTILSHGSIFDVPITKGLLESVKLDKQQYSHDLENKRKLKEAEVKQLQMLTEKNKEKEIKEKVQQELQELNSEVRQISDSLAVADDIVKEGNDKLNTCLLQKTNTRKEPHRALFKIETGMKIRQELTEEQQVITKRIKQLEHK